MRGLRILITSGATREPIDDVRYISNVSTGRTGARLAEFFEETGFSVTYLRGQGACEPARAAKVTGFSDFQSLDQLLKRELSGGRYFAVIHLAAVSDYSVEKVLLGERSFSPAELRKVDSGEELGLILRRNPKILDRLKTYSRDAQGREARVVGFKLTHTADESEQARAVERVASSGEVDLVVHNDLGQIRSGATHHFRIFRTSGAQVSLAKSLQGVEELGVGLVETFKEFL